MSLILSFSFSFSLRSPCHLYSVYANLSIIQLYSIIVASSFIITCDVIVLHLLPYWRIFITYNFINFVFVLIKISLFLTIFFQFSVGIFCYYNSTFGLCRHIFQSPVTTLTKYDSRHEKKLLFLFNNEYI